MIKNFTQKAAYAFPELDVIEIQTEQGFAQSKEFEDDTEGVGVDLLQFVTAFVIVAVAGGSREASGADTVFPESGQYFGLIVFGYLVDLSESLPQAFYGSLAVCVNSRGDTHAFV